MHSLNEGNKPHPRHLLLIIKMVPVGFLLAKAGTQYNYECISMECYIKTSHEYIIGYLPSHLNVLAVGLVQNTFLTRLVSEVGAQL